MTISLKKFAPAIFIVAAIAILHPGSLSAQDTEPSQPTQIEDQKDLPKHATWRVGEFGETPRANGIYRIAFSRDGKFMATRNKKNVVVIYDVKTRAAVCEVEGHDRWVESIDFSPDSRFFVTASGENDKVKIWNARTGKLESEIATVGSVAYFNDKGTLINVLGSTHVESYSWPGVQMTKQKKWKRDNERLKAMSRDGRYVIAYRKPTQAVYQTLLIDVQSNSKFHLGGPTAIPKTVQVSNDNLWVAATYHRDSKVRLWDLRNNPEDPSSRRYTLAKHNETVQSVSFSPDNRFLVSTGWDKKVIAWDLLTRQPIGEFNGHTEHVNASGFAPLDYSFATGASGTTDCSAIVWNLRESLFGNGVKPDQQSDPDEQFESIWKSLGTSTVRVSMKATASFALSGDFLLDSLENQIRTSVSDDTNTAVEDQIKLLAHPEFAVREKATTSLLKMRAKAEARLRKYLKETDSPEIRYRVSMILKQKTPRSTSDLVTTRRWYRTIFALEEINSERSQKILRAISDGHGNIIIAQHALAAYQRNVKRRELAKISK